LTKDQDYNTSLSRFSKKYIKILNSPQGAHPMPITKADIINSIYLNLDLQKQESRIIVESLLEIIKHTLESGEDVLITGFGKFCVKDKKERKGRNPQTASDMKLRARRVVTFKCSRTLRENLNNKKRKRK